MRITLILLVMKQNVKDETGLRSYPKADFVVSAMVNADLH